MAKVCCGKPQDTNFCPICGTKLKDVSGLGELLLYIRSQKEKADRNEKWRRENNPEAEPSIKAQRWGNWEKALVSIIEKFEA